MEENKVCFETCTCGCQESNECNCEDNKCTCGCEEDECTCNEDCTCGCHNDESDCECAK